jgi:hypothetical protein
MSKCNSLHPDEFRLGFRRYVRWAGSSVLVVLTVISVLGTGGAAAEARVHPAAGCQNLCVSVQPTAARVTPGQAASFEITVTPSSPLDEVTVHISVISSGGPPFPAPIFTSCGDGVGTQTCTLGVLQAGQGTFLGAQTLVPSTAPGGETARLSATVTWSLLGLIGAGTATGSATIHVRSPAR